MISLADIVQEYSMKLWPCIRSSNSLWARFIRRKYIRRGHILIAKADLLLPIHEADLCVLTIQRRGILGGWLITGSLKDLTVKEFFQGDGDIVAATSLLDSFFRNLF